MTQDLAIVERRDESEREAAIMFYARSGRRETIPLAEYLAFETSISVALAWQAFAAVPRVPRPKTSKLI